MAHPPSINLRNLVILVADPSAYVRKLVIQILRGFGANKLLEAHDVEVVLQTLMTQKIDLLLCDLNLPPAGGLQLIQGIRMNATNENRAMPILVMASDTPEVTIKKARDVGANMVIAKPISPSALFDRLSWIAFHPRQFIETANYFGPDRRIRIEGFPNGVGRRAGDSATVGAEVGPAMSQDDVDDLFNAARAGKS